MAWKLAEIKAEIANRIFATSDTNYEARGLAYFFDAMGIILSDPKLYTLEEIPDLVQEATKSVTFVSGIKTEILSDIFTDNVLSLYTIRDDASVDMYTLFEVERVEYDNMMGNEWLRPSGKEMAWNRIGNRIRMITDSTLSDAVSLYFIGLKDLKDLETAVDDLNSARGFSIRFLNKCISLATEMLKKEINME